MPMDPEISRSIFDKARDRYDKSKRIAFFSILALFLFHITTFQPYIDASTRLNAVKAETDALIQLVPVFLDIKTKLEKLLRHTQVSMDKRINKSMEDIILDFRQLNEMVRHSRPGESGNLPGETFQPQAQSYEDSPQLQAQSMVAQMVQDIRPLASRLPAFEDDVAERVKLSKNVKELRSILLPYVNENIIKVRFSALNQNIQSASGPLKSQAISIRDAAATKSKELSDYSSHFQGVLKNMNQFIQTLDTLSVQPPDNDRWWNSVQGKAQSMDQIAAEVEGSLAKYLTPQKSEQLINALQATINKNKALIDQIDQELQQLQQQFETQLENFQELGASMNFGVLNLKPVTTTFPLLLALVLAGLSVMLSRRIHELSAAIRLMPESQDELWEWLRRRIDMTGDTLFFDKVLSKESIIAFGSLGWIAIASWQVAGWDEVGLKNAALMYGLSVPLIAFAVWYRKRVIEGLANET